MQIDSEKQTTRNIDNLVSKRLQMRRLMLGLSVKETGEVIGVSPALIQEYEKSTHRISGYKLYISMISSSINKHFFS